MAHHVRKMLRLLTFNITAVGGDFAPEVIYCGPDNDTSDLDGVLNLTLVSGALPAGASLQVEALKPGTDPTNDANWIDDGDTWDNKRKSAEFDGMLLRVRAKSGGTAGAVDAIAAWTA